MSRFDEFEPDFDYFDKNPFEDPFEPDLSDNFQEEDYPRDTSDPDFEQLSVVSELEFKDGVVERLLEVIEEYLQFETKVELLKLIETNF